MIVEKHIVKEVKCCKECPYYHEEMDMSATLPKCELMGKGYDGVISDLSVWGYPNVRNTISKYCPLNA